MEVGGRWCRLLVWVEGLHLSYVQDLWEPGAKAEAATAGVGVGVGATASVIVVDASEITVTRLF